MTEPKTIMWEFYHIKSRSPAVKFAEKLVPVNVANTLGFSTKFCSVLFHRTLSFILASL